MDIIRKRRIESQLVRIIPERLAERIFDYFDENFERNVLWYIEVEKDLAEFNIAEDGYGTRILVRRWLRSLNVLRRSRKDRGDSLD